MSEAERGRVIVILCVCVCVCVCVCIVRAVCGLCAWRGAVPEAHALGSEARARTSVSVCDCGAMTDDDSEVTFPFANH